MKKLLITFLLSLTFSITFCQTYTLFKATKLRMQFNNNGVFEDIQENVLMNSKGWRTTQTYLKIYDKYIVANYLSAEFPEETFTFRDKVSKSIITNKFGTKITLLRVKAVSDAMQNLYQIIIELHPKNVAIIRLTDLVDDVSTLYVGSVF